MFTKRITSILAAAPLILGLTACENMPGNRSTQGAVIGGAAGAAAGAAIGGSSHRGTGALIGGLLGAGGGYVIGRQTDKNQSGDTSAATQASTKAQQAPATAAQAQTATTADVNGDGFVTLDEVVAMKEANLTDDQMIERLRSTGQVFDLTAEQQSFLREHGLSQNVIDRMMSLNKQATPTPVSTERRDVIGSKR